jgi:hypothetical protein
MRGTRVCSKNMHTSWRKEIHKIPTIDPLSLENNRRGCDRATNHHLGHHTSQSLSKIESHLVRLRMDRVILGRLHLNMEATLHMHLANLNIRMLLRLCHLSRAQSQHRHTRLQVRRDSGSPSSKNTNDSRVCTVGLLRARHISLRSRQQGGQSRNLNKCSSSAAS